MTSFPGHYAAWQPSVMASAGRDPYWLLRVRAESAAAGPDAAVVEDKCLRCHAAADEYAYRAGSQQMRLAGLTEAGREGVTCTVCHRIQPESLGKVALLSGGFLVADQSVLFGPHQNPFVMPMLHHTGYEPVMSPHILDAALCGSCHTLLVRNASGGTFAEQATWLEWLASSYRQRNVTCQSCHVPEIRDGTGRAAPDYIAQRPPGGPFPPTRARRPVGQHTFLGANVQMLETLADADPRGRHREQAEATRNFLRGALRLTATADRSGQTLTVGVRLRNLTGHKLPTGLPVRRLWLRVSVRDSSHRVLFESGSWDPETGEIRSRAAFEPHRRTISREDQTMIYETVMQDAAGKITGLFTQAARYLKDNRLLPSGFQFQPDSLPPGVSSEWIQPAGTVGDPDFVPGGDSVEYRIGVGGGLPPFRVGVQACYQSIRPEDAKTFTKHVAPVVIAETVIENAGLR